MDHIVICVHPFVMKQEISVYKNGECVDYKECSISDIDKICYSLCKEYNIHQVDYAGNQEFGQKIEEKLSAYTYSNFDIEFNYY